MGRVAREAQQPTLSLGKATFPALFAGYAAFPEPFRAVGGCFAVVAPFSGVSQVVGPVGRLRGVRGAAVKRERWQTLRR